MNSEEINKLLNYVYYDLKIFDSINELYRKAKVLNKKLKKEDVSKFWKIFSYFLSILRKKLEK